MHKIRETAKYHGKKQCRADKWHAKNCFETKHNEQNRDYSEKMLSEDTINLELKKTGRIK